MRVTTALNHHERLHRRQIELFSMARAYSWEQTHLLSEVEEHIYNDPAYKKCPGWVVERLRGVRNYLFGDLYQKPHPDNEVIWQKYEDGKKVDSKDVKEWSKVTGRHEWSKTGNRF